MRNAVSVSSVPTEVLGQKTWRLKITIREEKNMRTPIHPGVILGEELQALRMSLSALAAAIGVVPNRISQIVAGKRYITADTALRLARFFGMSPDFWMNLQKTYELDLAIREHGAEIERIKPYAKEAAACD
jgi:addiction module HigA family antidote